MIGSVFRCRWMEFKIRRLDFEDAYRTIGLPHGDAVAVCYPAYPSELVASIEVTRHIDIHERAAGNRGKERIEMIGSK